MNQTRKGDQDFQKKAKKPHLREWGVIQTKLRPETESHHGKLTSLISGSNLSLLNEY